jgi:membrane protein YqaA with SNARE-associated domain
MIKQKLKKYWPRLIFIVFILTCSVIFYYSSPEEMINFIGAENSYLIIFILSVIGGMSTFAGVPYHLVLITLATGGANPLILGTAAAVGVMIGDSTSYLIGYEGREIFPGKIQRYLSKIYDFGYRHPKLLPVLFFLYGALMPFSNDFIVVSAGLAKYPFKKVMIPLALGNLMIYLRVYFSKFHLKKQPSLAVFLC